MGLLDYAEIAETRMADLSVYLEIFASVNVRIHDQMQRRTEEIEALVGSNNTNRQEARKVIKIAAGNLDGFADTVHAALAMFTASRKKAFSALSSLIMLYEDGSMKIEDLVSLFGASQQMILAVTETRDSISHLESTIRGLPRLAVELNKAKRAAGDCLKGLDEEFAHLLSDASNIVQVIEAAISKRKVHE